MALHKKLQELNLGCIKWPLAKKSCEFNRGPTENSCPRALGQVSPAMPKLWLEHWHVTRTVHHPTMWSSSQCPTHIVCICGVLFPCLPWPENSFAGNSALQSSPVYGSQSTIHWRPRLMTPALTDWCSERDATVRRAPHTHKLQSIWSVTNKEMCP